MPYDQLLSDRIQNALDAKGIEAVAKNMFGGITFMVDDKMCIGVHKGNLMARVGPDAYHDALKHSGCEKMLFTGREMKGFVIVSSEGYDTDDQLDYWISLCLAYNPIAKSSKKRNRDKK